MDKSDKLTDLVYEDVDVRKSVEKRRDLPDNVGNAQTFMVTKETNGGKAFFLVDNNDETGMEKDTRYGEDAYKIRHGVGEIILGGTKRKRKGRRSNYTRPKQSAKLPATPCGTCGRNANQAKSIPCVECDEWVHLQKKCSGLESVKQYRLDYRCPRCTNNRDEAELDNQQDEQMESVKAAGKKIETTEKEELPVKVSPMREINKIGEKDPSERKLTKDEDKSKKITPNQTNEILTTIDGIQVSKEDRMSLEYGKNVTCTIISLFTKKFENNNTEILEKNKILIIQPAMTQLLQLGERTNVKEQKKHLNITKYDWIFFPISNRENPMEGDGGKHFSLLIFSKREHKFLHFDPVNGINRKNALDLMTNVMNSEIDNNECYFYKQPDFEEAKCGQQQNGFDCGPFVIEYMTEAIELINSGDTPKNLSVPSDPNSAPGIRTWIAKLIDGNIKTNPKHNEKTDPSSGKAMGVNESIEITFDRLDKLINEEIGMTDEKTNNKKNIDKGGKQNNKGSINEDKDTGKHITNKNDGNGSTGSKDNNKNSKNRVRDCRYYMNGSCRHGRLCRFAHREVCRGWKINGKCGKGNCTFNHPEPCIYHLKGKCRRRSCGYLHILERIDPERQMQQEKPTPMQKQQESDKVNRKQYHNQNFWKGQNRGQDIQKKNTHEEKTNTQQHSIDMVMGAMETLKKGLELILTQTKKH